jgi:membrane-associated protease RseP (regulator of RpoE activity)
VRRVLYVLGVLIFALGLLASIALHEIGHLVPAKKFGVKVTQYMVGFGPTVWSRRKGDTEYGVKAVPLGGYIRMIGMVPPRADGSRSRWPRRMATAVEEFRNASRAEVQSGDEDRQFYRLTPGKKMIVMLGGPTMNLLIYLVLTVVLLTALGTRHDDPTTTVGTVVKCVVPATSTEAKSDTCPANAAPAPAYQVLQPGDVIVSIGGTSISNWNDAVAIIERSAGQTLPIVVQRNGVETTLSLTPVENLKYIGATTKTKEAGYLGVAPRVHSYYAPTPITQVPGYIGDQVGQGLSAIGNYPSKIASLWGTVFEGKPRDPQGAIGVVGIGRLGGDIAQSSAFDAQDKAFLLISLLATVNLLLFFFNLLPLLPLDGGHVAGALVEAARRGRARLRERGAAARLARTGTEPGDQPEAPARRRPIYVDTAQMVPVMYAVASVLILVTLLVVYADIVKPVTLGG